MVIDHHIRAGIFGGVLFSTIYNISLNDLISTAVMSVIGAIVSFAVSVSLKKIIAKFSKE